ncbi:MAG: 5'-methylthioadenosine/adenosylhomocysteine nucleosidase [Verrucomicrobiales bacterium]|jgi:adenosylhomocysteine nucleosidase|nr:5'-methylthioadenosine/adenosylhomocysteine nucleosidase [Verrucomicrobiales bacterium]
MNTVGIMGAMPEEVSGVAALLAGRETRVIAGREYVTGSVGGRRVVVVFSRWGKVAAAATAATLLLEFGVTEIIFTGVAGAVSDALAIGDIVLARRLVQHDLDARPLVPRYEIPLLGRTWLETPPARLRRAIDAVEKLIGSGRLAADGELRKFGITKPRLHVGDIASGDQFFSRHADKVALTLALPSVLCVEMEGAAVAQVCHEHGVPCTVIRTISDAADEQSPVDFPAFVAGIASKYSAAVARELL